MKILILSSYSSPYKVSFWSGTSRNIIEEISKCSGVVVEGQCVLFTHLISKAIAGIELIFGMDLRRSIFRNFVTNLFLIFHVRRKSNIYDQIVFLDTVCNPYFARRKSSKVRMSLLLDSTVCQWVTGSEWGRSSTSRRKNRRIRYERNVLRNFDHFYSLTDSAINSLKEDFYVNESKISRVKTGPGQRFDEIMVPKEFIPKKQMELLTIAKGEHWRKGIDLLFEAISMDKFGNIKELNALLGKKSKENSNHRIKVRRFVSKEELVALFSTSDVFVLPCRFEPYGLVFIEAVRMGLPILTTENSGLGKEFIQSGWPGEIVEPDAKSILDGLDRIRTKQLQSIETRVKLQAELLGEFNWNNIANTIVKL